MKKAFKYVKRMLPLLRAVVIFTVRALHALYIKYLTGALNIDPDLVYQQKHVSYNV